MTPIERRAIDYGELGHWMARAEEAIRSTRRTLDTLARGESGTTESWLRKSEMTP